MTDVQVAAPATTGVARAWDLLQPLLRTWSTIPKWSDMELLNNPIQEYAWSSHTALARFLDRPAPTDKPQAELWIGAHPAAPSRLRSGTSLGELIAADPHAALGPESVAARCC